jgi:hypothetical protein
VGQRSSHRGPVLAIPDAPSHRVRDTTRRREALATLPSFDNIPSGVPVRTRRSPTGEKAGPCASTTAHPLARRVCCSKMSRLCHYRCLRCQEPPADRSRAPVPVLPFGTELRRAAARQQGAAGARWRLRRRRRDRRRPSLPSVVRRVEHSPSSSSSSSSPLLAFKFTASCSLKLGEPSTRAEAAIYFLCAMGFEIRTSCEIFRLFCQRVTRRTKDLSPFKGQHVGSREIARSRATRKTRAPLGFTFVALLGSLAADDPSFSSARLLTVFR